MGECHTSYNVDYTTQYTISRFDISVSGRVRVRNLSDHRYLEVVPLTEL